MREGRVCDFCLVNPADKRYREVTGIAEYRKQGGHNKIIAPKDTGRRPCADCVTRMRDGIPIQQGTLDV